MEEFKKGLLRVVSLIKREAVIDRVSVRRVLRELERELLKADVSPQLVLELSRKIEEKTLREQVPPGFSRRELLLKNMYEELVNLLGGESRYEPKVGKGSTILLVGLQGSGKTTTAAKLALYYKRRGFRVGLVCADNYRPGALEQLKQLSEQVGAEFYGRVAPPLDVALEGVRELRRRGVDIVIIDTAGRHKEEAMLLHEVKEIAEKIKPTEVMLVLDATIGKAAGPQAEAFHKAVPVGSIILTKMDGAARGGGALAAVAKTGARIAFIGVGEKVDELEPFDPPSFVSRLLGMGDLKALVEKLRSAQLAVSAETILSGRFTLLEFKHQLEELNKMGPLRKIFELLPGGVQLTPELEKAGSENLKKWISIMNSMTREELVKPEIINRSRMLRIARGSGTTVKDVKELLEAYRKAQKLMRQLTRSRRARLSLP
ncbi:MAG: signal recognition particle receptor subunit alpha [Thermofilaceae archaeon]